MKYTNMGSRLLMAASFVNNGKTVCDVGCDHGKLSLYLIKENKAQKIIATDINAQPLQKAIDLFEKYNLSDKAQFLLTDGLDGIECTDNITHIVMAGLGGSTMAQIIDKAPFIRKQKVELVLLPAQSGFSLRKYLYENGFEIIEEKNVEEHGKYYTCIDAVYTGKIYSSNIFDIYIGKSKYNMDYAALGYLEMILDKLKKKQKGIIIDTGIENEEFSYAINETTEIINNIKNL